MGPVVDLVKRPEHNGAIRQELDRVLASHEFRSSKRSQEFLRYIVDHTLNGNVDILKERTIGIEVFGRPTSYEPSDDATVRVKAGEVRKRLGLYYAGQGANDPVRIDLPHGTYIPEFHWRETEPSESVIEALPVTKAEGKEHPVRPRAWMAVVAIVVGITVAALVWWRTTGQSPSAIDEFWAPVVQGSSPVSLCAAFVPVYWPDRTPTSEKPLRPEDFTLLNDQFVGGGDLVAVARLSSMLTRMKRPYRVRIGSETSLRDLQVAPAILVGYSITRWKEISRELRFFIDGSRNPKCITDNGQPTTWALPNLPADRHTDEDYAIVSRVFHPDTHAMLVEIAGIMQYGTDAAADLVTNSDLMADALRQAPAGWQTKNLQLVLHVKVISGAPSAPKVVAKHFW
ncbi:MAG TPA: hypothetical protein VKU01_20045 [Bryobacteraceae bacterium]|nr:hypothetical protein [Bryobacteraceae bacterium]